MVNFDNIWVFLLGLAIGVLWMVAFSKKGGTSEAKSAKIRGNRSNGSGDFEAFQFRYLKRSLPQITSRLHGIIGLTDLWLHNPASEKSVETIKTINDSAMEIYDILADHLNLVRNETVSSEEIKLHTGTDFRVLVADDDPVSLKVTKGILDTLIAKVDTATDGSQAAEMATQIKYDLILLDIEMPRLNGHEATAEIRQSSAASSAAKIIALTAHTQEGFREKCLARGMDDFLAKPVVAKDLKALFSKWIPQNKLYQIDTSNNEHSVETYIDQTMFDELKEIVTQGSPQMFKDIYDSYLLTTPQNIQLLRTACERGDHKLATRIAHTIKGSSTSVGASKVSDAAKKLEFKAREEALAAVLEELPQLENDFIATKHEIDRRLSLIDQAS